MKKFLSINTAGPYWKRATSKDSHDERGLHPKTSRQHVYLRHNWRWAICVLSMHILSTGSNGPAAFMLKSFFLQPWEMLLVCTAEPWLGSWTTWLHDCPPLPVHATYRSPGDCLAADNVVCIHSTHCCGAYFVPSAITFPLHPSFWSAYLVTV